MFESAPFWMWILGFLLVLGPLVVIHELGHYLVGRWCGVKAEAFSVGFGKEVWGRTDKRGTRWKLSALPLGGYVQFAGDMNAASMPGELDDGLSPAERAQTFQAQPLWQRSLIVLAGPLTNFLFAVAVFAAFNLAYGRAVQPPVVVGFEAQSAASAAGIAPGDRIVAIDGKKTESVGDVFRETVAFPGKTVQIAVERDGRELIVPVALRAADEVDRFGNGGRVGDIGIDFVRPVVGRFQAGSVAEQAGLEVGDLITHLDGTRVTSFSEVAAYVRARPGREIAIGVSRDGDARVVRATPAPTEAIDDAGKPVRIGLLGLSPRMGDIVRVGPGEAVSLAVRQTVGIMKMMLTGIVQIVTGDRSVKELGGPIKIAKYSGEQLSLGWESFVGFVALISINLAFINLLPIPALDGGHLAFYAAEAVRRKPLGARSQEWAFRTGLALVLALMLFVTVNDVASLIGLGG